MIQTKTKEEKKITNKVYPISNRNKRYMETIRRKNSANSHISNGNHTENARIKPSKHRNRSTNME